MRAKEELGSAHFEPVLLMQYKLVLLLIYRRLLESLLSSLVPYMGKIIKESAEGQELNCSAALTLVTGSCCLAGNEKIFESDGRSGMTIAATP